MLAGGSACIVGLARSTGAQSFYLIFTFLERTGFKIQSAITVMSILYPVHKASRYFYSVRSR